MAEVRGVASSGGHSPKNLGLRYTALRYLSMSSAFRGTSVLFQPRGAFRGTTVLLYCGTWFLKQHLKIERNNSATQITKNICMYIYKHAKN